MPWIRQVLQQASTKSFAVSHGRNDCTLYVADANNELGLDAPAANTGFHQHQTVAQLRPLTNELTTPRIDSYRFSMANLEDSPDVDLDAILGELCALGSECDKELGNARTTSTKRLSDGQNRLMHVTTDHMARTHNRASSEGPRMKLDLPGGPQPTTNHHGEPTSEMLKLESRTDSPDNDSAFSDTVSMLSSESSSASSSGGSGASGTATTSSSSNGGGGAKSNLHLQLQQQQEDEASRLKAEKIRLAMEKIREANIQKLFVKVFTQDESAKSLLIDEKMQCSYVTRLLADKNHVQMDPKWAIVEYIPDLYMERFYEDHELVVENLMLWTHDSKNKIYFVERPDKINVFLHPERYLLPLTDTKRGDTSDYDEHSRSILLEEFFSASTSSIPEMEGPLYLKADSKKGWKKYYFVLRASGLYYYPKEKIKHTRDLVCLATFDNNHVYYGVGWRKKFKAPTDACFAIKHPRLQEPKSTKYIKYLCAEDQATLERWMVGMRIAKFGKSIMDNYRAVIDELAQEDLDILAQARSCSVSSIAVQSNATTPTQGYQCSEAGYCTQSEVSCLSGRHSCASSSSSSGCLSDGAVSSICENAFDSEFPMGTIKRKPSMKPSLPLTNITRQLKEVGETRDEIEAAAATSAVYSTNTGTLTRRHSNSSARRKSSNSDDSSGGGTLKRQHPSYKSVIAGGSSSGMGGGGGVRSGSSTPLCGTPVRERASPFAERPPSAASLRSPLTATCLNHLDAIPSCMTDSVTSLPPPPEATDDADTICDDTYQLPPPPADIYNSTLSLDSLPPPPNPDELPPFTDSDLTGSQLSLMSLPPPPEDTIFYDGSSIGSGSSGTILRKRTNTHLEEGEDATPLASPDRTPTQSHLNTPCFSPASSNCSTPTWSPLNNSRTLTPIPPPPSPPLPPPPSSTLLRSSLRHSNNDQLKSVNFQVLDGGANSPKKLTKKISFNLLENISSSGPPLPKKPPPPKRADTTKLSSSPKKLSEPPTDFLNDLQRVMRKKWQVAQKCKLEPATTPHEVLGFRDAPPTYLPDYKEHNVSNWVQEHYGASNVYENVYAQQQQQQSGVAAVVAAHLSASNSSPIMRNSADFYCNASSKRAPPPPPPKRSETTHLTTTGTPSKIR